MSRCRGWAAHLPSRHRPCSVAGTVDEDDGSASVPEARDDGRGITEHVAESGPSNMRGRGHKHGGKLAVLTASGEGTTITWIVPTC